MVKNVAQNFILWSLLIFVPLFSWAETKSLTKVKIGLNWKPDPEFAVFYQAHIDKAYEKNGIDAELIEGGAGTPTVQMVASGQIAFGVVSGDEVIVSRDHGSDVVAVYTVYDESPTCIMARTERNFKSLKELF